MTRDNSFILLDRRKRVSIQKACLMLACLTHLGWRRSSPDAAGVESDKCVCDDEILRAISSLYSCHV